MQGSGEELFISFPFGACQDWEAPLAVGLVPCVFFECSFLGTGVVSLDGFV